MKQVKLLQERLLNFTEQRNQAWAAMFDLMFKAGGYPTIQDMNSIRENIIAYNSATRRIDSLVAEIAKTDPEEDAVVSEPLDLGAEFDKLFFDSETDGAPDIRMETLGG